MTTRSDPARVRDSSREADTVPLTVGSATSTVKNRLPEITAVIAMLALWSTGRMIRIIPIPDNVAYLDIADHWAAGRFSEAVNGYWSPLFSWLLIPFSWIGAPSHVATALLGLAFMVAVIDRVRALCRIVTEPGRGRDATIEILLFGSVPFVLFMTFGMAGPDQLMALLVVMAFVALLDAEQTATRRGLLFGTWAALAFLAKAFALPFMLAVGLCWVAIALLRRAFVRRRDGDLHETPDPLFRNGLRSGLLGIGVLMGTAALWSVALSLHYDELTVSRTATYHAEITAPGAQGNPFAWAGLLQPTNPEAVSAWEDPTVARSPDGALIDLGTPGPVTSTDGSDGIDGRRARILDNLNEAMRGTAVLAGSVLLAAFAVPAVIWSVARRRRRAGGDDAETRDEDGGTENSHVEAVAFLLASSAIYVGGLLLVVVEARYLWPPMLLTVPVSAWALTAIRRHRGLSTKVLLAASLVVAIGSGARSIVALIRFPDVVEAYDGPLRLASDVVEADARVASITPEFGYMGACRRAGCTYWGSPASKSGGALVLELRAADIDYLVVAGTPEVALASTGLTDVGVLLDNVDGTTIFDVRDAEVSSG